MSHADSIFARGKRPAQQVFLRSGLAKQPVRLEVLPLQTVRQRLQSCLPLVTKQA
jgi:hypothetical protein